MINLMNIIIIFMKIKNKYINNKNKFKIIKITSVNTKVYQLVIVVNIII